MSCGVPYSQGYMGVIWDVGRSRYFVGRGSAAGQPVETQGVPQAGRASEEAPRQASAVSLLSGSELSEGLPDRLLDSAIDLFLGETGGSGRLGRRLHVPQKTTDGAKGLRGRL